MGKYTAVLSIFGSNILDLFRIPVFRNSVNKFFINIFEEVVEHRMKEKVERNDFIKMLMDVTDYEQKQTTKSSTYKSHGKFFYISMLLLRFNIFLL